MEIVDFQIRLFESQPKSNSSIPARVKLCKSGVKAMAANWSDKEEETDR
jgi:hypothetical protein